MSHAVGGVGGTLNAGDAGDELVFHAELTGGVTGRVVHAVGVDFGSSVNQFVVAGGAVQGVVVVSGVGVSSFSAGTLGMAGNGFGASTSTLFGTATGCGFTGEDGTVAGVTF